MESLKSFSEKKISSEKSFGITFSIVFIIISLYLYINHNIILIWPIVISVILLIVSFIKPNLLKIPNLAWNKLGYLLGNIISPVIMGIIFFSLITPTGIIIKLKRKFFGIRKNTLSNSYWEINKNKKSNLKDQF